MTLDAVALDPSVLLAGDLESMVLYEALAYDILRNSEEKVVRVFPGLTPVVIDEMELWQIAGVLGEHRRPVPIAPVPPPDIDKRAEVYAEAMKRRGEALARRKAGKSRKGASE